MTTFAIPSNVTLVDDAGIPALQDAIRNMHGAESEWLESVPVRETFQGEVVWDGEVQVFALVGHTTASRCYAWSHATEGGRRRFYAVLHVDRVNSPHTAVQATLIAGH